MDSIQDNLKRVQAQIAQVCLRANRSPEEVTLIAVSKQVSPERIKMAYDAGHRDFGESYWQEAREKFENLPTDIRWHFIGHLQTNKARFVVGRFELIHSIDSEALASALSKRAADQMIRIPVLMEVNIGGEASKYGVAPEEALDNAERMREMPGIDLRGLMGLAPYGTPGDTARPYFQRLRSLFEQLPVENRQVLSMGMSGDFEAAIEEGSTMVRLGTAIFGSR